MLITGLRGMCRGLHILSGSLCILGSCIVMGKSGSLDMNGRWECCRFIIEEEVRVVGDSGVL